MENTKCVINESIAKSAKESYSFSDYVAGSATSGYKSKVEKFNVAVDKLIEENKKNQYPATAEQMELVEYYRQKYAEKLAAAINKENEIISRCPSIMIAGGSNFPVAKKEKQTAALDKHYEKTMDLYNPTENYYYEKIETILTNKTIYSNDMLAIEKLENKLQDLTEFQQLAKEQNAYYRKNGTMKGFQGMSEEQAKEADARIEKSYSWDKQPVPSYTLSNNSAEIRRIKERIETLKKLKTNAEKPIEDRYPQVDGIKVVENAEAMRIQLIFDGKPDDATRDLLKHNGFKWSPRFTAWQRQLTQNGIYATKKLLEQLKNEG